MVVTSNDLIGLTAMFILLFALEILIYVLLKMYRKYYLERNLIRKLEKQDFDYQIDIEKGKKFNLKEVKRESVGLTKNKEIKKKDKIDYSIIKAEKLEKEKEEKRKKEIERNLIKAKELEKELKRLRNKK